MGQNSNIEWTTHTFNPWRGCTKVSEGCAHCYAETLSKRNPSALGVWGQNGKRVVGTDSYWRQPIAWNKAAANAGERHRVFCASLADVFEGPETMPASEWPKVKMADEEGKVCGVRIGHGSTLTNTLIAIIARAGLERWESPFHDLRRSRAQDLADAGVPPKEAASMMGHSVEVMMRFYVKARSGGWAKAQAV